MNLSPSEWAQIAVGIGSFFSAIAAYLRSRRNGRQLDTASEKLEHNTAITADVQATTNVVAKSVNGNLAIALARVEALTSLLATHGIPIPNSPLFDKVITQVIDPKVRQAWKSEHGISNDPEEGTSWE